MSQLVCLVYPIVKFALSEKFVKHMLGNTRRDSDAACIVLLTSNEVLDSQTGIRIQKYNTILKLFFLIKRQFVYENRGQCLNFFIF